MASAAASAAKDGDRQVRAAQGSAGIVDATKGAPGTGTLLRDILDSVVLDVRRHEATLLKRVDALERELANAREAKARADHKAAGVERRRVNLMRRESSLRDKAKALAARGEALAKREEKAGAVAPAQLRKRLEARFATTMLDYMVRCEELLERPTGCVAARDGLTEESALQQFKAAAPRHLRELDKALERLMTRYREEGMARASREQEGKSGGEESKVATATAAARVRERKAQREKKELIQTLVTVHNLCCKVRDREGSSMPPEIQALFQIVDHARNRFVPSE
mmetsp:Transcript_361/g.1014  ORF Transcript_361/g.1014 Transcript_361/m.1014 type:complete len:284 (+) Transcript_361:62-913(+)